LKSGDGGEHEVQEKGSGEEGQRERGVPVGTRVHTPHRQLPPPPQIYDSIEFLSGGYHSNNSSGGAAVSKIPIFNPKGAVGTATAYGKLVRTGQALVRPNKIFILVLSQ